MDIKLLIVCEGVTDQALLGCYIESVSEWKFCKKLRNNPFPEKDIVWYTDGNSNLLGIWSNNSDCFNNSIEAICERESYENIIENLLIITDNDDAKAEKERLEEIYDVLQNQLKGTFEKNELMINEYNMFEWNGNFASARMNIGYLLVPLEGHGAMETFMLDALSESMPEREDVISQVKRFLESFKSNIYLLHRRERVKAELGIALSIMDPDKSFKIMKELIELVDWKSFDASYKQFQMIRDSL